MMPALSTASTLVQRSAPARVTGVTGCKVDVVTDLRAFLELEAEWNDAVRRAAVAHPFLRHEWIRTWLEAFAPTAQLHVVVVRVDGRIAAIAPLMRDTVVMYGFPVRRIRMIQNDHTPRAGVIVASHPDESYRAIWNSLEECRDRWDVVLLSQLEHESPARAAITRMATASRCPVGFWKSSDSPYVALDTRWDDYFTRLPAKFRSNLRNRLSRARRAGEVSLEVLTDYDAIDTAASDAWRLEASGWKKAAGTAITCDPAVHTFYSRLIERGTSAGWLQLLFLKLANHRVAVSYGACFERRLFLFKTGYDPEYAECAPFKLLTYLAIRDACERGLCELDFLGDSEPWKLEWTSATRGHDWMFVFADTPRARLLHSVKFQWGPGLKRWWA